MFRNIGKKIKVLAKTLAIIGIVFSCAIPLAAWIIAIINPFILMLPVDFYLAFNHIAALRLVIGLLGFFIAIILAAIFSLLAWISCFTLYGFGELVDRQGNLINKVDALEKKLDCKEACAEEAPAAEEVVEEAPAAEEAE